MNHRLISGLTTLWYIYKSYKLYQTKKKNGRSITLDFRITWEGPRTQGKKLCETRGLVGGQSGWGGTPIIVGGVNVTHKVNRPIIDPT